MRQTFLSVGLTLLASGAMAQDKPELTVYAPDYFSSEWGPGPAIEAGFEEICGCDLVYLTGDLMPRLLLERERTKADIVIGLTTDETKRARESGLFQAHGIDTGDLTLPIDWTDDTFIPFNWGQTAFVYDNAKLETPPTSFEEFLDMDEDIKVVIQDPRSSISGLALILWMRSVYGDGVEDAFARLAPKVLTVTKGWSEAYGLFTDGEADMVLSYTTSPAYHVIAEEDLTKSAAIFEEGHYFMAELVGTTTVSDQPELAAQFMDYVLSDAFQGMIATANWSFPAKLPRDQLPEGFANLAMPEKTLFYSENDAAALRDETLDAWLTAFSR